MSIILAIDIGTGSTKALAVDHSGREVYNAREGYAIYHPEHNFSEQYPDEILTAVKKVIRDCPPEIKNQISAISFSSAMHSVMAVDHLGKPLTPFIIWSDLRSKEESRALRKNRETLELLSNTGTPVHPMSPLCKIMWLRKNQPEVFAKTHKFIGIKEYIWFKLFEVFEVDQGIASAAGLLETGTLKWFSPALSLAGIHEEHLSTPVSVYHYRTLDNKDFFAGPVKCVIGSSDGCLANLGSFAMDEDVLSLTIGTSAAVRRAVKRSKPDPSGSVFRYHLDEETIIEGGASNNGALVLEWWAKNFLKEELDTGSFIGRAIQIPEGSEGLIFLPYVFGERAPQYDPDATGAFVGIRQYHTTEHFMRAILEGVGFAVCSIAERVVESSGAFTHVAASGGFIHSPEWVQIIADIFGKPIMVNAHEEASALGAAMLGFRAIGDTFHFPNKEQKVFHPDTAKHEKYRHIYASFKQLGMASSVAFQVPANLNPEA